METVRYDSINNSNISFCKSLTLTDEEIEEKEQRLNKKIIANKSKITKQQNKIKQLEAKIKELEEKRWEFKVGDIVLYDGWRKARIIGLIDYNGYMYKAKFCDTDSFVSFKQKEIVAFDKLNYEEMLINKIVELKTKEQILYRNETDFYKWK